VRIEAVLGVAFEVVVSSRFDVTLFKGFHLPSVRQPVQLYGDAFVVAAVDPGQRLGAVREVGLAPAHFSARCSQLRARPNY